MHTARVAGGVHGRGHAWWGACVARGVCMAGACMVQGVGMHGRGEGLCMARGHAQLMEGGGHVGGMCRQGACMHCWGCAWKGEGVCMARGHAWMGEGYVWQRRGSCMAGGGVCMEGGYAWQGACMHGGGVCGRGPCMPGGVPCDLSHNAFDVTCMLSHYQLRVNTNAATCMLLGWSCELWLAQCMLEYPPLPAAVEKNDWQTDAKT